MRVEESIEPRCGQSHLTSMVVTAVLIRLAFWVYTDRIWEDALISATPARNVWEGFGLTHHASEPRVHSFTSDFTILKRRG